MQRSVDTLKVMLDFAELVALPCALPRERCTRLAAALADHSEGAAGRRNRSPLVSADVRAAIWVASDIDGGAPGAEHFRSTVLRRICCRDDLLNPVFTDDNVWLTERLFSSQEPPSANVAGVVAALLEGNVSIVADGDDGDEGPLAVLIKTGECSSIALDVVNEGLRTACAADPDPLVATVVCDVIQHCLLEEIAPLGDDEERGGMSSEEIADLLPLAKEGLKDTQTPARVVASAAFVKTVLSRVADAMKNDVAVPATLTAALNDIFNDDHHMTLSCAIHLLTQLRYGRPGLPISGVADACRRGNPPMFPTLAGFRLCQDVDDTLPCDPLNADPAVVRLTDALAVVATRPNRATAAGLIEVLQESADGDALAADDVRRAALSIVLHRHVLRAATRGLDNADVHDGRVLEDVVRNGGCAVAEQVIPSATVSLPRFSHCPPPPPPCCCLFSTWDEPYLSVHVFFTLCTHLAHILMQCFTFGHCGAPLSSP
jgi:hypothetical protein